MKKIISTFLALVIVFTSCCVVLADEVTTIEFWTWRPEDVTFYDEMIARFEEANPDVKVNQTAINNTEYFTVLAAAMANNAGPDVMQMKCYGQLQTYIDSNYLAPLEEYIPELADFSENARRGAASNVDGVLYGVPAWSQAMLCYYNKSIYEELGLSVPDTWDDFTNNLANVKRQIMTL